MEFILLGCPFFLVGVSMGISWMSSSLSDPLDLESLNSSSNFSVEVSSNTLLSLVTSWLGIRVPERKMISNH